MSNCYADFCLYCTGNDKEEIHACEDLYCPFYPFRFGNDFNEPKVCKQILIDTGVIEKGE